jgi:hypothetical protein
MPASTVVVGKTQIIGLTDTLMQFPWTVFLAATVARSEIDAYKAEYPGPLLVRTLAPERAGMSSARKARPSCAIPASAPVHTRGWAASRKPGRGHGIKGISPSEIDVVVFTHLTAITSAEPDRRGKPTFRTRDTLYRS